jgi:hypothetical protein
MALDQAIYMALFLAAHSKSYNHQDILLPVFPFIFYRTNEKTARRRSFRPRRLRPLKVTLRESCAAIIRNSINFARENKAQRTENKAQGAQST